MKQYQHIIFGVLFGLLAAGLILLISKPVEGEPISLSPAPTPTNTLAPQPTSTEAPILVQVEGEVNNPGIYSLHQNARLEDLIDLAGSLTDYADNNRINRALLLRDGDYIKLSMTCEDAREAALIVNEMVSMFIASQGSSKRAEVTEKLSSLEMQKTRVQRDLDQGASEA